MQLYVTYKRFNMFSYRYNWTSERQKVLFKHLHNAREHSNQKGLDDLLIFSDTHSKVFWKYLKITSHILWNVFVFLHIVL